MTYFALTNVTDSGGVIDGLKHVFEKAPERFSMILSKGEIITPTEETHGLTFQVLQF